MIRDVHGVIAGTEPYTRKELEQAENLKVIARVGVGLDSIDFDACRERNIVVTYTPEAPADAVAELALANIINLARRTFESDRSVREHAWNRLMGSLLREIKIGILGVGRIGKRMVKLLQPFRSQLFGCDLVPDIVFGKKHNVTWVSREEMFATCDIISIHIPLNLETHNLVGSKELRAMPRGGCVVNTSRGPILDEDVLFELLQCKHLGGAALDVFKAEPYEGPLAQLENVILTAHIGASARGSRFDMELGAAQDCVRVLAGQQPTNPVTDEALGLPATKELGEFVATSKLAQIPASSVVPVNP